MKKSPYRMNGMTFKEGQSPMRKVNIGKKIGKFVKSRVERVVSNVKNVGKRVKSLLNDDENGNGNSGDISQTSTKPFNPVIPSSAPSSFAPPTAPKPPSANPITKKKRSGFKMKKSPAKNYKKGYYGI
jgi:hypothetical protein